MWTAPSESPQRRWRRRGPPPGCNPLRLQGHYELSRGDTEPSVVILSGPSRSGKTRMCRRMMLDWASGKLFRDKFYFVFYLNCKEMNKVTGDLSFVDLVSQICKIDLASVLKYFPSPRRFLFVIDGCNDLHWSRKNENELCQEIYESAPKEILLQALLRKKILRQSALIVTTTPQTLSKLESLIPPGYRCHRSSYEVPGLAGEDVQEFVRSFFGNQDNAEKVLSVLVGDELLRSMCAVPVVCRIMCTALRPDTERGSDLTPYNTATSIYLLYLKGLLKSQSRNPNALTCLGKLCSLANEGVLNKKFWFVEEDLGRHQLSPLGIESIFPNKSLFYRECESQILYSFIHQSVQEFLAALYYGLGDGSGEEEGACWLRKDHFRPEICKGPTILHLPEHLTMAVRFLFGLLNQKEVDAFFQSTGYEISLRGKSKMGRWLMEYYPVHYSPDAISCMYETQDANFIKELMSYSQSLELSNEQVGGLGRARNTFRELHYCLKNCEPFQEISLSHFKMLPEDLDLLMPYLQKSQLLSFSTCDLPSRNYEELFWGPTKLNFSYWTWPEFAEERPGETWLFAGLRHPDCTLQELSLNLTPNCCPDLCSILTSNRSLIKLDLSDNNFTNLDVNILCEGLRDPECAVRDFRLRHKLIPQMCSDFRLVLITNRSLSKLDLSNNNLLDSGVKMLCEGLRHPGCSLQELKISYCGLTSVCCEDLRCVLITSRCLTKLKMDNNKIGNSGAKYLCEGLRHKDCILQKLSLYRCGLTGGCCKAIRSVFITNRSLIKLNLSGNHLKDSGVKVLCEGLKHPDCTLQELSLAWCLLSPLCCDDLSSVFNTSRCLTKLDLSQNHLEDSGVKLLKDGFRDLSCIPQGIRFYCCDVTSSVCSDVSHVIKNNKLSASLSATGERLRVSGVKILCEGLRNPACALQELGLSWCRLTPSCCDDLHSVLIRNQSLIKLDLAMNTFDDCGIKRLCEALRHPACNLKEIRLECRITTSSFLEDLHSLLTTNLKLTKLDVAIHTRKKAPTQEMESWCDALHGLGCIAALWLRGIQIHYEKRKSRDSCL